MCLVSAVLACLSGLIYLIGVKNTPVHTVYLGASHYWEDFMFYTSQFMQGSNGAFTNTNLFTEETTPKTLLYFPNILLGHIGQILPVMPSTIYNVSCILLSFFILIAAYILLVRLFPNKKLAPVAWMFFAFSTSLMNKLPAGLADAYWPFDLWGTPHYLFNRLGGMPHRLVMTLLFFMGLALLFDKKISWPKWMQISIAFVSVFGLTLIQPIATVLLLGVFVCTALIHHKETRMTTMIASILGGGCGIAYLLFLYVADPYMQALATEGKWQTTTSLFFLLRSIGPVVPFTLIGMITRKKWTAIEQFGGILLISTYALFLFPVLARFGISNVRLLLPAAYLFVGWFAAVGVETIAEFLPNVTKFTKNQVITLCCILFCVAVSPTIVWEIQQKVITARSQQNNYLHYLPTHTYDAFVYLKTIPNHPIVLGNPTNQLDTLIPALSGQKTVTGPLYATINHDEKIEKATQLYMRTLTTEDAHAWLREHHVTHLLFTIYDGDRTLFQTTYPFVTPLFSTPTAVVYGVQ